jgi:hypothetical protein
MFVPDDFPAEDDGGNNMTGPSAKTLFGRLKQGKPIGKKSVLLLKTGHGAVLVSEKAPVDILSVQGEDDDAMELTITLGNPQVMVPDGVNFPANVPTQQLTGEASNDSWINTNPTIPIFPCGAVIDWGAGGSSFSMEVDYVNGACVTVRASYIRVRGFMDIFGSVVAKDIAHVLAAFISPGRVGVNGAQRTLRVANALAGPGTAGTVFAVPKFAKSAYVVGWGLVGLAHQPLIGTLDFSPRPDDTADSQLAEYQVNTSVGNQQSAKFPIPNGGYYCRWTNGVVDPLYQANARVVFDLAV